MSAARQPSISPSIDMIETFFAKIGGAGASRSRSAAITPPLPILRAIAAKPVGIVQIDCTPTRWIRSRFKINHATTFRRGVEEG
jgi:hypothetical protein